MLLRVVEVDIDLLVGREGHIDPSNDHLPIAKLDQLVHLCRLERFTESVHSSVLLETSVLPTKVVIVWNDKSGTGWLVTASSVLVLLFLHIILWFSFKLTHLLFLSTD